MIPPTPKASRLWTAVAAALFVLNLVAAWAAFAEDMAIQPVVRIPWKMDEKYGGPHQDSFQKLRFDVPILMRQTMIDMAGRLGMNFEEGWTCPLTIKFVDDGPSGIENVLAYVAMESDGRLFHQSLNVNLAEYDKTNFEFEKVFAHELVHAMMNDAVGGQSAQLLPTWFNEGLAVYGSEQGEKMVRSYTSRFSANPGKAMINGLEGEHTALDYAEDYLAFKYIYDTHGVNSLHNFVREVTRRKGDIPGAIAYTCSEDWKPFQEHARTYAEKYLDGVANSLRDGKAENPY